MNMDIILQLINTVGFPIFMVFYFIYDRTRSDDKFTSSIDNISEALNNNTLVMRELLMKMEGDVGNFKDFNTLPD